MAFNWGIRFTSALPGGAARAGTRVAPRLDESVRTHARAAVRALSDALDTLEAALPRRLRERASSAAIPGMPGTPAVLGIAASATSSASIDLVRVGLTAARMDVTAGVDTATTSCSLLEPSGASGAATSPPGHSGLYTASTDTTYRVRARDSGTLGLSAVRFRVFHASNVLANNFTVPLGATSDDSLALVAGVEAAFAAGTLVANREFHTDGSPLVLDEGTTVVVSAVDIAPRTFERTLGTLEVLEVPATPDIPAVLGRTIARTDTLAKRMEALVRVFNRLHDWHADWAGLDPVTRLRASPGARVTNASGSALDSAFGLRFQSDESGRMTARFGAQGRTPLGRALRPDLADVRDSRFEARSTLGGRSLFDPLRRAGDSRL